MTRAAARQSGEGELKLILSGVQFLTDSPEIESLLEPLMQLSADIPGSFPTETARMAYEAARGGLESGGGATGDVEGRRG